MLDLLKEIFKSLFFVYKNIFHFIFSKILIIFSSIIIWFLVIVPFVLVGLIILYFNSNINSFYIDLFRGLLFFIFLYFSVFNLKFLFAKLSLNYIEWKKMKFKIKNYFNVKLIVKNIQLGCIILLALLLISLFFIFLFWILIFSFWWIENTYTLLLKSGNNLFSIISFIFWILYFIVIFYFLYKVYFSYYILLENEKKTALKILKKSFKKTWKIIKIFKLLLIFVIFYAILFPFNYYYQLSKFNTENIWYYIELNNKINLKDNITEKEKIDFIFLEKKLWNFEKEELVDKFNNNSTIYLILTLFYFIFIFWIFDLVMAKFYIREIK